MNSELPSCLSQEQVSVMSSKVRHPHWAQCRVNITREVLVTFYLQGAILLVAFIIMASWRCCKRHREEK